MGIKGPISEPKPESVRMRILGTFPNDPAGSRVITITLEVRDSVEVELPVNTTRWFFTVTTTKRPGKARRLKKNPSVLTTFSPGIDQEGYEPEPMPTGEGSCSAFLLKHTSDSDSFVEAGGVYFYYPEYSVKDIPAAGMLIDEPALCHGTQYIGLQNPMAFQETSNAYVVLTVVAMTR